MNHSMAFRRTYDENYYVKNTVESSHNGLLPKSVLGVDKLKTTGAVSYRVRDKPDSQPKICLKTYMIKDVGQHLHLKKEPVLKKTGYRIVMACNAKYKMYTIKLFRAS